MTCRVAIAQLDVRVGDLKHNVYHHLEFIRRARKEKANLILFPELSLTGYSLRDLAWEVAIDPLQSPALNEIIRESGDITIVLGLVENGRDHGIYNSALVLEDGKVIHVHRKIYPPTYGMFEEGRYYNKGNAIRAFDSRFGRFGVLICEDSWHPGIPYVLASDGAQTLLALSASPTRLTSNAEQVANADKNHEHHRAYARLLSVYYVFCNRVGFEDGVNFWGGSSVTDPGGLTQIMAKYFDEDLIIADLNEESVRRARRFSRHVMDDDASLVQRELERILKHPSI
ncbi:MAG: carbon-nitrogen hydrolase [Ignavibacteria bacterium]|nr:carbon-nitrogen hydrolase [Ignavibacteria bacterium]